MTFFDLKLFRGQALGFVKSGTKILIGILLLVADLLLLYVVKPRPAMVFNDATTWWHITAVLGALAWAFYWGGFILGKGFDYSTSTGESVDSNRGLFAVVVAILALGVAFVLQVPLPLILIILVLKAGLFALSFAGQDLSGLGENLFFDLCSVLLVMIGFWMVAAGY